MRRLVGFVLAGALLSAPMAAAQTTETNRPALAEAGRFGLGLGGTNLTSGISGKLYLGQRTALQAVAGTWWTWGFSVAADYLWEQPNLVTHEAFTLHWYIGAGPTIALGNADFGLAGQAVGGLSFQLREFPLEITGEIRPTVAFVGHGGFTGFYFGSGGAIRYFF